MWQSRSFKALIAVLAGLVFNNWVLGPWLNPVLFKVDGSISEFSISNQPHYWVFRSLDMVAGAALILLAYVSIGELGKSRLGKFILIVTAVLGISNIADAIFTLSCSETLSTSCSIPVKVSLSHYQVPAHAYSSVSIALCYFLLPLGGLIYGLRSRVRPIVIISSVALGSAVYSFGSALGNYIRVHSLTVRASGDGQGVEMIIVSLWLLVFYIYLLYGPRKARENKDEP